MKILLVEDDEILVELLAKALTAQHYVVEVAIEGQAGWDLAENYPYDLIVLDVVLPKLDGISFCRRLRSQGNSTPILLLTAKDTSTNKVMGLDAGADDYMTKPFDLAELLARIRALLRRGNTAAPPPLKWGNLELDPSQCKVTYHHQTIHLTPKEYGLLQLFLHHPSRIFSCGALIDHLWAFEEPPTDETVRSHLKGLRHKLKLAGISYDPIETVYGIGYRLKPEKQETTAKTIPEPSSSPPQKPDAIQVETGVQDVWQQVQNNLRQRLATIQQATTAAQQGKLSEALRDEAEKTAHKLIGSLGMFGSDQGSQLAQQLEQLFEIRTRLNRSQIKKLTQLTNDLHQAFQQMKREPSFLEPTEATPPNQQPRIEARVLVVDDDDTSLTGLQRLLTPWGLQVLVLNDSMRFLEVLQATSPDLVILDEEMPNLNGTDLCQTVRSLSQWQELPILFLTAHADTETIDRIFAVGADDFVSKPVLGPELVIRVIHRLERSRFLRHRSEIDPLTGVANRRRSSQALTKLIQQSYSRQPHPNQAPAFYFALVVVDSLKQINFEWGHAIADQVLCRFGELLQSTFSEPAIVGRWGGAEFVVGIPESIKQSGLQALVNIVTTLERQTFSAPIGTLVGVRCLVGFAEFPQNGTDLQTLYQAATAKLAPALRVLSAEC